MYNPKIRNNTIPSSMLGAAAASGFLMDEYKRTQEETSKMESCDCSSFASGGEMSPRLWICDTHGRSGFSYILRIISKYANDVGISEDESWDIAKQLLEKLSVEKRIYFCEDHFEKDLEEYYYNLLTPNVVKSTKGFFKILFG